MKVVLAFATVLGSIITIGVTSQPPARAAAPSSKSDVSGLTDWEPEAAKATAESTNLLRWKPCTPIKYTIDVTGAPMSWAHDIHDGFKAASAATGIPIQYVGRWEHGKPHTTRDPVLIYYKDDPAWAINRAAGYAQVYKNSSGRRIIGGYIIVNPAVNNTSHAIHRRMMFHEIGHIFGLPHPSTQYSSQSVMGAASPPYKAFDLWMFKLVGRQRGEC